MILKKKIKMSCDKGKGGPTQDAQNLANEERQLDSLTKLKALNATQIPQTPRAYVPQVTPTQAGIRADQSPAANMMPQVRVAGNAAAPRRVGFPQPANLAPGAARLASNAVSGTTKAVGAVADTVSGAARRLPSAVGQMVGSTVNALQAPGQFAARTGADLGRNMANAVRSRRGR